MQSEAKVMLGGSIFCRIVGAEHLQLKRHRIWQRVSKKKYSSRGERKHSKEQRK